jgi:ABC-type antimicrobial peptide transport system permease subunit
MEKDRERKMSSKKNERDSLATLYTLTLWRLRQTWKHLLMIGVALLAACTIACIPALFSSVADTAGLQGLFNGAPERTTFALNVNANRISSATVPAAFQRFEKVIRPGLGNYLASAPAPLTISTSKLSIMQPERLNHTNPFNVYATSLQQLQPVLHLVQGRWADEHMTNGVLEFMLTTKTAQALNLKIGATLTLQSNFVTTHTIFPSDPRGELALRLVGTFADPSTDAPALHGATLQPIADYTGPYYTLLMANTAFLQACDQIAAREHSDVVQAGSVDSIFHLSWYYQLRADQLHFGQTDDLTTRLANVQYKVNMLGASNAHVFPYLIDAGFLNPASANADMLSLLNQYTSRIALINLPVSLLALQIIALLLFFACLLTNQLVDRQMAMSAQLSSRGASPGQMRWSLSAQGIILSILALVLGPLLASLLVYKLASQNLPVNELAVLSELFSSPQHILLLVAPYLAGTFLVGLLAIALPCQRASTMNILELRREATRTGKQPFWLRYYLDLLAALLALGIFGVSLYLAQVARVLDEKTQELVIAPLTLVAPLFLLLGALLLFLRVFPFILRLATRLSRPARGTTSILALVQMARNPQQTVRLIMLLTLATTFASFALVFSASQNQRALDIAAYESGADFAGDLPEALIAQTQQNLALPSEPPGQLGLQIQQALALRYSKISGVFADSAGYTGTGSSTGLGGTQVALTLHAVDTSTFAHTAIWGAQDSSQSLSTLLNMLHQSAASAFNNMVVPVIVDETTRTNLHLAVGNVFDVTNSEQLGTLAMSFQVVAVVQHIPGVNGSAGVTDASSSGGLLIDYQTFNTVYLNYQTRAMGLPEQFLQPLPVNYLWLRTSDTPGALASVRAALNSPDLALGNLYDRRTIGMDLQNDPLIFSVLLLLSIGGITALTLAFLGNLLASWLNVRLRLSSFVVLRALGATRWQVVSILLWEQGIVYLVALLFSLVLGGILIWLVVPELIFTGLPSHGALSELTASQLYLLQRALPPQVVIPATFQLAMPAVVIACALALFLMARIVLNASYGQELRLNED